MQSSNEYFLEALLAEMEWKWNPCPDGDGCAVWFPAPSGRKVRVRIEWRQLTEGKGVLSVKAPVITLPDWPNAPPMLWTTLLLRNQDHVMPRWCLCGKGSLSCQWVEAWVGLCAISLSASVETVAEEVDEVITLLSRMGCLDGYPAWL
ncbi:MAG: hypothetical protein L0Z62_15325 [Gemmataceae bacterium]|nr:hypothetical protein [Gemmataceae bacterium]